MELIAEFGCNWKTIKDFETMVVLCRALGIKYVKLQMWRKNQVPKEVRPMYVGPGRAKYCFKFAKKHGIELFFSVFYPEAVDICEKIGVNFYKVRYQDRNDYPLYKRLKKTNKTIFVSCSDPMDTLYFNLATYQKRVKFLYCVPRYPTTYHLYKKALKVKNIDGFSDHTQDLKLFEFAREIGYPWFELHVCEDKKEAYEGKWSKTFKELKEALEP
jgi:sialic acid synthase SpsE